MHLEVAIARGDAPNRFRVKIIDSPGGESRDEVVVLDVEGLLRRRDSLQQAILASAVSARSTLHSTERPVREVGEQLFNALLGAGQVAGVFRASEGIADASGEGLRVVLRIDDPALAGLPWEAMYDDSAGSYVCHDQPMVRHVPVARVPGPLTVQPPLRILAIASSPRGLTMLDVEKEQEQLTRALARPIAAGRFELQWAKRATWSELQDMLLDESASWHVVHFIGHGDFDVAQDTGILALVGDDGRAHMVDAERFVNLLRQARPMLRLVVLNACSGATSGQLDLFAGTAAALVRGGVTAVAAMQFEITDPAAIAFTRGFYTALANNRGIDEAIGSGRTAIMGLNRTTLEWVTPVLYLRGQQTRLFTVTASRSQQPASPMSLKTDDEPRFTTTQTRFAADSAAPAAVEQPALASVAAGHGQTDPSVGREPRQRTAAGKHWYQQAISQSTPGCVMFLVDRSESMKRPWARSGMTLAAGAAQAVNKMLLELCVKSTKEIHGSLRLYFYSSIIGYGFCPSTGKEGVEVALPGPMAGRGIVPLPELAEHPIAIQEEPPTSAGGVPSRGPVWIEPYADLRAPMCEAIDTAGAYLYDWAQAFPDSFPPIILNITGSSATDSPHLGASLDTWASRLTSITTNHGPALLFNAFLSPESGRSLWFPDSAEQVPPPGPDLFSMSSLMPTPMLEKARYSQVRLAPGARGFMFNADVLNVLKFLQIGTSFSGPLIMGR